MAISKEKGKRRTRFPYSKCFSNFQHAKTRGPRKILFKLLFVRTEKREKNQRGGGSTIKFSPQNMSFQFIQKSFKMHSYSYYTNS